MWQSFVKWLFSNVVLPSIKEQIPSQPNWTDSESVRLFFDKVLDNKMLVWTVKETSTKIDDNVIAVAKTFTSSTEKWQQGWVSVDDIVVPLMDSDDTTAIGFLEVTQLAGFLALVVKVIKQQRIQNAARGLPVECPQTAEERAAETN